MQVKNINEIDESVVTMEGAVGAKMRLLISENDGAENFAMRMFTVEPGGHTPFHDHDYEHEVFVLDGSGLLKGESGETRFKSGDVIFVEPNEKHQFVNAGDQPMRFICLIPALNKGG